jgi:hypothetical protein
MQETNGLKEYKHSSREISQVRIKMAGLGTKCIRIADLPPEVPEGPIIIALAQYEDIKSIQNESWSKAYCYAVSKGIKILTIALKEHIPSHATIACYRVLIAYEGQPMACYGCNATDHVYQICPKRLETTKGRRNEQTNTWAHVARHDTQKTNNGETKSKNDRTKNNEPKDVEHITEEATGMDMDPECSTKAGPSIPIEQEPDTLNTDSDNRCNLEVHGTTKTERQNSRNEEDEKCCDEQYIGPNPLQHENPNPTTTELENANKTTKRINTNRVDKTINDIIQTHKEEWKTYRMYVTTRSDQKNSNLKAMANRQPKGKGVERETRRRKRTNNAGQVSPPPLPHVNKHSMININGLTSTTRMQMLQNFIYKHDINIHFMQEVTHPSLNKLSGYTVHYNIGSAQRGTAIVARDNIELANITRIPPGRAIAAEFKGIWLVNIYAPSVAAKRNERKQFFYTELTYILRAAPENIILGGD